MNDSDKTQGLQASVLASASLVSTLGVPSHVARTTSDRLEQGLQLPELPAVVQNSNVQLNGKVLSLVDSGAIHCFASYGVVHSQSICSQLYDNPLTISFADGSKSISQEFVNLSLGFLMPSREVA